MPNSFLGGSVSALSDELRAEGFGPEVDALEREVASVLSAGSGLGAEAERDLAAALVSGVVQIARSDAMIREQQDLRRGQLRRLEKMLSHVPDKRTRARLLRILTTRPTIRDWRARG